MKNDESVSPPVNVSDLRSESPEPSCGQSKSLMEPLQKIRKLDRSDLSQDKRSDLPEPSCVSMKSDWSMDHPNNFSDRGCTADLRTKKKKSHISSRSELESIFKESREQQNKEQMDLEDQKQKFDMDEPKSKKKKHLSGGSEAAEGPRMAGALDLTEQEMQPLNEDDFNELLNVLKIKLPALVTADDVKRSTHPNVIEDAQAIIHHLTSGEYSLDKSPHLACYNIVQPLKQKEEGNVREITKDLFLKLRGKRNLTLKTFWDKYAPKKCRFTMKHTYKERTYSPVTVTRVNQWFGSPEEREQDANDCLEFYYGVKGKPSTPVSQKLQTKKFGFLSARVRFIAEYSLTKSRGSRNGKSREKKLLKCYAAGGDLLGKLFSIQRGNPVQLDTNHELYMQALANLYILREEDKTVPVSAVIVVKVDTGGGANFYWGDVSKDTSEIDQLNNFCQEQAVPRFLALLNLIFEKQNHVPLHDSVYDEETSETSGTM